MARLPRLVLPGQAHWLIQRAHGGRVVLADEADRTLYLTALREAAANEGVLLHAHALLPTEVQLLATPATATALARLMQAVGRRFVAAHHKRHGGSGTLWDGRFRCAVVEPGVTRLAVLLLVDGADTAATEAPPATSAGHRSGGQHHSHLVDPPEYWQLGNTPFDRETAYRRLLAAGVPAERAQSLRRAALGGWPLGSAGFAQALASATQRPAAPRPRGRPARKAI